MSTNAELLPQQVLLLSVLAVIIAQVINYFVAKKRGEKAGKMVATLVCFAVSVALAYGWIGAPLVGVSENPTEYAVKLIGTAGTVMGFATLIYNVLMERVFKNAGWTFEEKTPVMEESADRGEE